MWREVGGWGNQLPPSQNFSKAVFIYPIKQETDK